MAYLAIAGVVVPLAAALSFASNVVYGRHGSIDPDSLTEIGVSN